MIRAINLASYGLDRFCRWAASGFLTLMLLLVLFQVMARYIFQAVPVWTEELARYCMVWGGLLGATAAFRSDQDPRLVQPPSRGPRTWLVTAFWLRALAVVVFLGPVLYHSDRFLARGLNRLSEGLEIPLTYVTVAVPLAVVIIFFHLLARIVNQVSGSGRGRASV